MNQKKGATSLNYNGAKITTIPKEVLKNKDTLKILDVSGNNFKNFNSIIRDLKQLKNLKKLKINIFTQEEAKAIIEAMPNLEYLNDEPINDDDVDSDNNNEEKKQEEKEIITNLPLIKIIDTIFEPIFKKLQQFYNMNKSKEKNFQVIIEEFNNLEIKLNISKKNYNFEELNNDEIKKRLELYSFLNNKLNKIKEEMNNKYIKYNQKSFKLFQSIIEENDKIKNKCNKLLNKKKEKINSIDKENELKKESMKDYIKKNNNKKTSRNQIKNNFNQEKKNYSKENNSYNSNNKNQKKEKLLNKFPSAIGEKITNKNIFSANTKQYNKKPNETLWSNKSFNKFNENLKSPINSANKSQNRTLISEKSQQRSLSKNNQKKKYKNQAILIENYHDPSISSLLMKNKTTISTINLFDDDYNEQIEKEKLNIRIINLNNLLDIINQVYKIRNSRIQKQKEGVYNKATLEHDLYNYLKSKYGLKKLIIEWNINILSAIHSYIKLNGEVYLFALILKNELDEDSIEILYKIKKTVNNILNLIYDYDINVIEKIKQNKEFIKESEWKTINKCLYSDDDNLKEKFNNKVSNYIDKVMKGQDLMVKTGKKILFSDYINLLIFFNLKLRKNYLHNLFVLFSEQDKKRTGIIDSESFKTIIKNSGIINDEEKVEEVSNDLLEIADKEGSGQITFNDIVQCLDNLDLIIDEGKFKFLDKLAKINVKN